MNLLERLTTTRQAGAPDRLKILVHGESGSGKTTLCGTTPDPDRTLIISAEAGLMPLRGLDIPVFEVRSLAELRQLYLELRDDSARFDWINLDSISEIAEQCLSDELKDKRDGRAAYGEMARSMMGLIKAFRGLNCHVVMTCKQDRIQDDVGRLTRAPSMPGNRLTREVPYHFDLVLAMRCEPDEDGEPGYFVQTRSADGYLAKDRSGVLAGRCRADLGHIYRRISGTDINNDSKTES